MDPAEGKIMDDNDLLKALGRLERERRDAEQHDPWRALTEGALSAEERRELEARADRTEEGRRLRALAAPVGQDLADRLLARMAAEQSPRPTTPPWWRGVGLALSLSTAAASVVAYVATRPDAPGLPAYAAEIEGGDARLRGADAVLPERALTPDSVLSVTLRPDVPVEGGVDVRVFLAEGAALRPLGVQADVSAQGAVRIGGRVGHLLGADRPGAYEIVAVIGRPEHLPADADTLARVMTDSGAATRAGLQVFRVPFHLTPPR
jgi:hypothetical protein